MPQFLIITNGSSSVELIAQLGLPADLLSWDDVLHDGPLRFNGDWRQFSEDRAEALTALGFGEHQQIHRQFLKRDSLFADAGQYQEVVLWFEHDLYDQLQLVQIICQLSDSIAVEHPVTAILTDQHISSYTRAQRQRQWQQRRPLNDAQRILAHDAWLALTATEPVGLLKVAQHAAALPHLQAALERWFGEYPDPQAGLSLTERYILEALSRSEEMRPGPLFGAYSSKETASFMGDWSFWRYLWGLTQGPAPAVRTRHGASLVYPPKVNGADFLQQSLQLTDVGRAILAGDHQWFCHPWQQRWLGGVSQGGCDHWRWHAQRRTFYKVCLTGSADWIDD